MKGISEQGKAALLVIDVQKGLFERATPIHKAEQVLQNINALIRNAPQVIEKWNKKIRGKGATLMEAKEVDFRAPGG
jgi:hypothetical protein